MTFLFHSKRIGWLPFAGPSLLGFPKYMVRKSSLHKAFRLLKQIACLYMDELQMDAIPNIRAISSNLCLKVDFRSLI